MRPLLARWGRRHAAGRVRRDLDGLHVAGLDGLAARLRAGPVLAAANHVGWWDGLVALALGHVLDVEVALLARPDTLARHPWMGAFGVLPLPAGPGLRRALRDAAAFLDRPGRIAWIFPQGRHRPEALRPLGFRRGVAVLARTSGAPVVPVSLAYPFREAEAPAAAVVAGPSTPPEDLEPAVEAGLGAAWRWADGTPAPGDPAFAEVLRCTRLATQDGLGARILGWVLA